MKKSVSLLAVLGTFTVSAFAQTSTTVYGFLDTGITSVSTGASTNARSLQQLSNVGNSSRLGFTGTEDLGGGLAAFYTLEMGLNVDTGAAGTNVALSGTAAPTTSFFNRGAFVGVKGGLGTLGLGRQLSPASPARNANALPSGVNSGIQNATSSQGIVADFWNSNSIRYDSPEINGFVVKGSYILGEVAGSTRANSGFSGAIVYDNKSGMILSYSGQKDYDATGRNVTWQFLSASYQIGALRIAAGYDKVRNNPAVVTTPPNIWQDSKLATVGARYNVSPRLAVGAQYFKIDYTVSNTSSKLALLNAHYELSKRTALYVMATGTKNGAVPISSAGIPGVAYANGKSLSLGIQHTF